MNINCQICGRPATILITAKPIKSYFFVCGRGFGTEYHVEYYTLARFSGCLLAISFVINNQSEHLFFVSAVYDFVYIALALRASFIERSAISGGMLTTENYVSDILVGFLTSHAFNI